TDGEGTVWIATVDGLFCSRNGTVSRILANDPKHGEIFAVAGERDGGIWMGTSKGLFRVRKTQSGVGVDAQPGVPGPVVAILKDRDGVLWVGTWGQGLYRVRHGAVDSWKAHEGLADDYIRTLYEDQEGNLWIGTRAGGLTRWNDTAIVPYGVPEGLSGDFASTVTEDRSGALWFGTWRGGLYRKADGIFQSQPTPVPTLYCTIRALAIDPQGNPWIGNWEGLYGFNGRRYDQFAEPGSPFRHVSAVLFDRSNRLWVGTSDNGLFLFPSGKPTGPMTTFLAGKEITSLFEDSRGRIWAGMPDGMGSFEGARPGFTRTPGIPGDMVTSIAEDSRGRICATTLHGTLYAITGDRTTVLTGRQGLPDRPLYRIVDDGVGSYWISSGRGILRIRVKQVDEILAGARQRLDFALYDRSDGMRTIECHRMSQPSGWRDHRGRVWFPTAKGFVAIQPEKTDSTAPPVVIETVTADGRPLPTDSEVRLSAGTHSLELQYTALSFSHPEKVRFRYRLEGFDPGWVEAGADRTARYSRIPPGRYRFLVTARMPAGPWSTRFAAVPVRQPPKIYQTVWFRITLALASLGVAVLLVRWRIFIIKGRYAAVLAERNRISREWHDTLLAGFSAISWQLEETLSRLREAPQKAAESVHLALKMVHHYRTEARRVIWQMRESRLESETLVDLVSAALRQLTDGTGIRGEVQVSGRVLKLPEDLER
ncbi:MAG TPA: two-component regulator propeller domain-containing protein, partial [Bryobacteraceae bacterium]|nr:two-component regulator propeller domain-containing protein [Bryobacteraceae bacterium]